MNKKDKKQTAEIIQFIAGCISIEIPEEFGFATFIFPLNNKDGSIDLLHIQCTEDRHNDNSEGNILDK